MLLVSVCVLSAATAAQQPQQPARARRGGLDNLSLPSTTARAASASSGAVVWQTFAPEGAGFSVSLPGRPEQPTARAGRESGGSAAQVRNYRLASGGLKYEIGRTGQLPEQLLSQPDYIEKFFAGASRGMTAALAQQNQQSKFKLVSEEVISLDGYEGREYQFDAEGQRAVARLFLVERSIFGLSVIGPKSEMTPEHVERFLNSFALAQ
jgi:hypothetical protein